jgi:hypothetical protein
MADTAGVACDAQWWSVSFSLFAPSKSEDARCLCASYAASRNFTDGHRLQPKAEKEDNFQSGRE